MKILLLNTPDTHVSKTTSDWDIEASDIGIFPPMGILYLASSLRKAPENSIRIIDCILNRLTVDEICNEAMSFKPDIIGLTVYTPLLYDAYTLSKTLKSKMENAIIIWGGPHVMLFPKESVELGICNFILQGECEDTLPELCEALRNGTSVDNIPGIGFKKADGSILLDARSGYIKDINKIPFPAYDLVDFKRYYSMVGTGQPVASICSSRGCPFSCTFCCKPYSTYRTRSVENILGEMKAYHNEGIREFFFFDDLFNSTAKRVSAISQGIIDNGWKILWAFRGRVDAISDEMLGLAKKSGCRQILFGVEDATDEGLKLIKKKITVEQVKKAVSSCRKHGIITSTNWIIGFPHHKTRKDIVKMMDSAIKINSDYAQINILMVYHGTEIFEQGVKEGLFDKDVWRNYASNPTPVFLEPTWDRNLSREELSELLNLFYRRFYFRTVPIFRKLRGLRSLNEFKLHVKGALTLLKFYGYRRSTNLRKQE